MECNSARKKEKKRSHSEKQRQINKVVGGISESCLGSSIENVSHSIDS